MTTPTTRWRTVLVAVVLFVAGAVTGAGLTVVVIRERLSLADRPPAAVIDRVHGAIARRFDLREGQRARVRAVLEQRLRPLVVQRRRAWAEQIAPELRAMSREIRETLDPGQARRWERRWEDLRRRWMPGPGVPGDG